MISVKAEKTHLKPGIYFYPWGDKASFGFRVRTRNRIYKFKWSKYQKRFMYINQALEDWMVELPEEDPFTEEEAGIMLLLETYGLWRYEWTYSDFGKVLVTNGKDYAVAEKIDDKWYRDGLPFVDEVKYWMFLPKPPEEDKLNILQQKWKERKENERIRS